MTALGTNATPRSARPRPSIQEGAASALTATAEPKCETSAVVSATPPPPIRTAIPIPALRVATLTHRTTVDDHHPCQADPPASVPPAVAISARTVAVQTQP